MSWPIQTLIDLFGIEHPIIQAPMAGASNAVLAAAVSNAGALVALVALTRAPSNCARSSALFVRKPASLSLSICISIAPKLTFLLPSTRRHSKQPSLRHTTSSMRAMSRSR